MEEPVWLERDKLNDYKFYQFWRNVNDLDVTKFLKLFTRLPLNEIKKLSKLKDKEINEAKKILAFEVTKICRGEKSAKEAFEISKNIFDNNINDERLLTVNIKIKDVKTNNFTIIDALEKLSLVKSRSDAKRLIKSQGIKIDDLNYQESNFSLIEYIDKKEIKISVGKKKIGLIKFK